MKIINDKTKKWLVVIGCLAVCVVLVVLIGSRFTSEKPVDQPLPSQASQPTDVTVNTDAEKEKDVVVTPPDTSPTVGTDNGAVSTGTDQTIQGDVSKPEYSEDQLTDPSQKPNGEKVTEPPASAEPPKSTPKPTQPDTPKSGDRNDKGEIYVPGFGWVEDSGEDNTQEEAPNAGTGDPIGDM